eukprot:Awhi_evm1s13803
MVGNINTEKALKGCSCPIKKFFNYLTEPVALFCAKCKLQGMVNFRNRTCFTASCSKFPKFNFPNETSEKLEW